jgi:hypothetical protein
MSGITKMSPRASMTESASGVVGPLVPSAMIRHLRAPALLPSHEHVALGDEERLWIDFRLLREILEHPDLPQVAEDRFQIEAFRVVQSHGVVALLCCRNDRRGISASLQIP